PTSTSGSAGRTSIQTGLLTRPERAVDLAVIDAGVALSHVMRNADPDLTLAPASLTVRSLERQCVDTAIAGDLRGAGPLGAHTRLPIHDLRISAGRPIPFDIERLVLVHIDDGDDHRVAIGIDHTLDLD